METFVQQLARFLHKPPTLGTGVFIAHGAVVLGDVTLGDNSSVWYNAVLRGDINRIQIGHHSNIQDTAVLHVADRQPCVVGNYVTIGHGAIVHGCTVRDEVLIGMKAIVLDGATIGAQSIIGAGAVVPEHAEVPPRSLVLGVPGEVERLLNAAERGDLKPMALRYAQYGAYCLKHGINVAAPLRLPAANHGST
jgi:carbonic anhydrase/acetyltransferase-like protein (isoleucine patch superfamily)